VLQEIGVVGLARKDAEVDADRVAGDGRIADRLEALDLLSGQIALPFRDWRRACGGLFSGASVMRPLDGVSTIVPGFGRGGCCWVAVCACKAVLAASMTAREVGSSRFID